MYGFYVLLNSMAVLLMIYFQCRLLLLFREQMIIFVYDTGFCQTEADDPQKAVLFFHPHWVSDQQRLALCGQLMGAAHFCSSVFSSPRVLTLQCGKFVLKKLGRYILSVGSDQSLAEWILQERFHILELFLQFYHNSLDTIFKQVESDQETFSKRLTEILEVYIPILQFIVCSVGTIFVVRCPKRNSSAFLEAFQLLEACCSSKGVLGGVVLHNSKVIATQLDPDITKLLVLTDKFHIRTQAVPIKTSFHLPVGVQLLKVYLKRRVYETLLNASDIKVSSFNGIQKTKSLQKVVGRKKEGNKIFTVHEEEDLNSEAQPTEATITLNGKETGRVKSRKCKPKTENTALKERSKSFVGSLNIKVCSTPTVEKTLIHEELVSICSSFSGKSEQKSTQINLMPGIVEDAFGEKARKKYLNNLLSRMSTDDLMIDFAHKAYPMPLRYFRSGQPMVCREVNAWKEEKKKKKRRSCKTIADPMNPVFRDDGIPVSKALYDDCLDNHYKDFVAANLTIDSREQFLRSKYLEKGSLKKEAADEGGPVGLVDSKPGDKEIPGREISREVAAKEKKELTNVNQKAFRRSLSLPLKPLLCDAGENASQNPGLKNKVLMSRTPTTPLTTKLSLLAIEEKLDAKAQGTPIEATQIKSFVKNLPAKSRGEEEVEGERSETVPSSLFICACQNMTIILVLDENAEKNPELILSLWEISLGALKKVENLRNKTLSNLPTNNGNNSYNFLSMDSHWGTVQKSGPWGEDELKVVGSLHEDLVKAPKITEIIVRNEESVVYGYSCGGSKIFYQQGGCSGAGLPTPADLMGVVTLKARRRLERDRDIVLL